MDGTRKRMLESEDQKQEGVGYRGRGRRHVRSMRCSLAFRTIEPRSERLWALIIGSALLISRTVSVEYGVVNSLQGIKEGMRYKKIKLINTTVREEWQ